MATGNRASRGEQVAPVAIGHARTVRPPKVVRSAKNGDIVVEHEEFVQDVNGSVGFANTAIPINPGQLQMFPWLAQMAPLYESYRFEDLEFRYQSMSSTTSTGSVMLATEYDSADSPAVTKSQLAAYRGFVRTAPWGTVTCRAVKEDLHKRTSYFVRPGSLGAGQDIQLYDTGFLNVATSGQANGAAVGELYVKYRVRLMTPQLLVNGVGTSLSMRVAGTSLASAPVVTGNAPITVTGTGDQITLTATAPYQSLIDYSIQGTGLVAVATTGSTATINAATPVLNGASTALDVTYVVSFQPGQTLVLDLSATTTASYAVRLGQYASSLF
jgi:hypothetical protein